MLIFLAGLRGIPEELYEVARIDGAGAVRRFLTITLPLLTPVIMFQLVWGLFGAANVFVEPILLSPGLQSGLGSTVPTQNVFVNLYALQRIFGDGDFGYGAAIATFKEGCGGTWVLTPEHVAGKIPPRDEIE